MLKKIEWFVNLIFYHCYLWNNYFFAILDIFLFPIDLLLKIPILRDSCIKAYKLPPGTDLRKWFRKTHIQNLENGHSIFWARGESYILLTMLTFAVLIA